jgi:hypothetical protein
MLKRLALLTSLFLLFALPAAAEDAAPADAAAQPAAAPADPATMPADPTAEPAPTATAEPTGTGTIVFFRPKKMLGMVISFQVREGGTELGKLSNGAYFSHQATAGTHQYAVHTEAKDVLTMEVEAGKTYYVQGTLGMGLVAGRPNLSPSDQATFDGMKGKLKDSAAKK